jgi:hypothetical protein
MEDDRPDAQALRHALTRVLLACSPKNFAPWAGEPLVGRLLTPNHHTVPEGTWSEFTAMDNMAYSNWSGPAFLRMLDTHRARAADVRWVACPDVVGDWRATRARFGGWRAKIERAGYRVAYVIQDGQPPDEVPWDSIAAVFVGGTDRGKHSREAFLACGEAKERGLLVHVGRVNSVRRVRNFFGVMNSFDGLSYSKFARVKLPPVIQWLRYNAPEEARFNLLDE